MLCDVSMLQSCGGSKAMGEYLSQPAVVKALHVKAGTAGMRYGPRDRDDLRPYVQQGAGGGGRGVANPR